MRSLPLILILLSSCKFPVSKSNNDKVNIKYLENIWWSRDVPQHAVFQFDKKTVFYVDQEVDQSTFPYLVQNDSLIIKYTPGHELHYKIEYLSKDTLILQNDNGLDIFTTHPPKE